MRARSCQPLGLACIGLALLVACGKSPDTGTVPLAGSLAEQPAKSADLPKAGSKPGEEWDANGLKMKFCWCPPGKFTMGCPAKEKGFLDDDQEQVEVTLSRGFWLGVFEVTQGEWQKIIGKTPSRFRADAFDMQEKLKGLDTSRFPVEQVSWDDITEFCKKLTEQERKVGRLPEDWEYRLPTEAQWEYACRAGTTTATAFGDKLSSKQANFDGRQPYKDAEEGPFLDRTTTVGSYKPNAWGLYDMHGNVSEWCLDWYAEKLPGGTDPEVKKEAKTRVIRGGNWFSPGRDCRAAKRQQQRPSFDYLLYGFRMALVQSK